jgi:hypothetical protein
MCPRPQFLYDYIFPQPTRRITALRSELQNNCHQLGNQLICDGLGIFHHYLEALYLGSLFENLLDKAMSLCPLTNVSKEWDIIPVDSQKVINVFTKNGRNVDVICRNGSRTNQLV